MKKNRNRLPLILIFLLSSFITCYSQGDSKQIVPEHIILNLTETPSSSIAVNWRTSEDIAQFVQWVEAGDSPTVANKNLEKQAISETVTYIDGDIEPLTVTNHSVIVQGLQPNTSYLYRVGAGEEWSEWFEYQTAGFENEPFSFIYLGDAQNNIKSHWSRVIRKAFATDPDAGFILYAGDLINHTNSEQEWQEWFYAGDFIHATIPSIMTPGNHEYDDLKLDNHWRPQFTLPLNGPEHELLLETTYFVDYQNLRVISIDADAMDESAEAAQQTAEWLENLLKENKKQWTILTLHYPFYSTKPDRDNPELRNYFQPLLEKYRVDMVLTGHDHAYGRGMETIASMTEEGEISGPMYVVSVSGPKQYDLSDKGWMTRKAGNTQLFQVISIDGKKLNFKAYTATGKLYDEFDLVKQRGKRNKLVNKIPKTPERLYTR